MMKKLSLLALVALLLVPALAYAQTSTAKEPPPGNIYDGEPFSSGVYFSSMPCVETFACDSYLTADEYLQIANICSSTRRGYPADMLKFFEGSGAYANCALPDSYMPKGNGFGAGAQWPICCFGEVEGQPGQCRFTCHSYISG